MGVSGPIESVTINNRRFPVDGEVTAAVALPGSMNEVKPNGDGSQRLVKSVRVGRVNTLPLVIDNDRGDMEFLQDAMNENGMIPFAATEVDGAVWDGSGQIVEDPEKDTKEGTMEVSYAGSLRKQP